MSKPSMQPNNDAKYEVHIAIPKLSTNLQSPVIDVLNKVGINEHDYFVRVYNVPQTTTYAHQGNTPPTGHDIEEPWLMSTALVPDFETARNKIIRAMGGLTDLGVRGHNFELERILKKEDRSYDLGISHFPGFQEIDDSPKYENHFVWRGMPTTVPTDDQIVTLHEEYFGLRPHQIVDFATSPNGKEGFCRVSTVYQPTLQAVQDFAKKIRDTKDLPYKPAVVAEQVHLVAELKR